MTPELIALLIAAVVGSTLAWRLDRRAVGALLAGEALLLGIATSAGVLFVLSLAHVPWSRASFVIAMLVVFVVSLPWRVEDRRPRLSPPWNGWTGGAPVLHAITAILVLGYLLLATAAPIWEFDFIGDWGLKARIFALARGIDWGFLQDHLHHDVHADYPPLLPLAFDAFAVVRGGWNDATIGLLSVALAVALLLVVNGMAREETESPRTAAFITLALVPFACSPWIGLAEGALVAFVTAGVLLIRRGSLTPGAVMLGLAASTKNEGLTFILAVAVALAADKRPRDIVRLWPAVAIPLPWLILRRIYGLHTDITQGDVLARVVAHLRDPGPLFIALLRYPLGKPFFWLALGIGLVVVIRPLLKEERFVLVALVLQFLFYLGAYFATPHDVDWHVHWSWERLISHLSPLLTYLVLARLLTKRPLVPML